MKVTLDYGLDGLDVELPDDTVVVEADPRPAVEDPAAALAHALDHPTAGPALHELVSPGDSVVISVCDGTRPQPHRLMVEALLVELRRLHAADDVTVLIATGTHRGNSPDELVGMLGDVVLAECDVVNHDCRDRDQLVSLGTVDGDVPVALNRRWVEADVRITTGFVEPHFFAGFSGGPKLVAPGLASLETVMALHNARRIGDPAATWGIVRGNPVHDAIRATAATCMPTFSMDVLLNAAKDITHVFSGSLWEMHERARGVAREVAMQRVPRRFPIVVTTNSGHPLDQNLYQAVKGMSAAAEIVEPGGTIVIAAACRDGLPDHGVYADLLASGPDIQAIDARLVASPEVRADQWQLQVQARVQRRARVLVHSDGLTTAQVELAHLEPVDDIGALVAAEAARHPAPAVAVLPQGPQTIAWLG